MGNPNEAGKVNGNRIDHVRKFIHAARYQATRPAVAGILLVGLGSTGLAPFNSDSGTDSSRVGVVISQGKDNSPNHKCISLACQCRRREQRHERKPGWCFPFGTKIAVYTAKSLSASESGGGQTVIKKPKLRNG